MVRLDDRACHTNPPFGLPMELGRWWIDLLQEMYFPKTSLQGLEIQVNEYLLKFMQLMDIDERKARKPLVSQPRDIWFRDASVEIRPEGSNVTRSDLSLITCE